MSDVIDLPTAARLLRQPIVLERVGLSAPTLWRMRKAGLFPQPVKISAGAVAWRESDINAWIASREAVTR